MNRVQYFWLGVLSSAMLCISILFIGTGKIVYGPDAIILAVMGWMFYRSVCGIILSIQKLFAKGEKHDG